MREKTPTKVRIPALNAILRLAGLALLTACAATPGTLGKGDSGNPWIVTINFMPGRNCEIVSVVAEPNECRLADPADICVKKEKHIQWNSNPADKGFLIYFDPIATAPLKSSSGKLKRPIDKTAPPAFYKYTIMGSNRECSMDNPAHVKDPHIRVDK